MSVERIFTDERGISPVIGVILMVVITVILAAVIGTFVLGFGDGLRQGVNAGVSVDQTGTDYTVTLVDSGTADSVELRVDGNLEETLNSMGDSATVSDPSTDIQVIAITSDGRQTVVRTIEV